MNDYFKHLLIRTPLERPAILMSRLLRLPMLHRHPELYEIHVEPMRIERALSRLIHPMSNCVDVGAHVGSMLSFLMRLAPNGSHHAFEPVAEKARRLRRKFPEVRVHETALGDEPGEVTFFINGTASGYSGLKQRTSGADNAVRRVKVQRKRLDDVLPHQFRVDFLKVDVEGGELHVLRGATRTLHTWRPIILFESTKDGLDAFDVQTNDVYRFLCDEFGYGIHTLRDFLDGGLPMSEDEFRQAHQYPFQAFNFLAATSTARPAQPAVHMPEFAIGQRLPISCLS